MIKVSNKILIIVLISLLSVIFLTWWKRNNPYLNTIRESLIPVDPLFATVPVQESNESYTNKDTIYVCIRDEDNEYYDVNTLRGVLLHELAHVKTPFQDPDHKSNVFKNNEMALLDKAKKLGLWDPKSSVPCDYCNVDMRNVSCNRRPGKTQINNGDASNISITPILVISGVALSIYIAYKL